MSDDVMVDVPIETLVEHPDNPRRGDVAAIVRSLERFGQVKPIIVQRSTAYIVAGNHTVKAAKRLGWKTIKALVKDLDDETARAYLIADNRTADRAGYDKGALMKVLGQALVLEGTGFDEDDLEMLQEEVSGKREAPRAQHAPIEVEDREVEAEEGEPAPPEPMREIPLRMPASQIERFSKKVVDLQQLWGARTLVEIVDRAVDEAHERWQADVKTGASNADALPELAPTEF